MPGFLDKLKEGAEKASFEAERMRRLNQERSALRAKQRQLDTQTTALGQQVLTLYDASSLTQPELLLTCQQQIDSLRQQIAAHEAKIEEIRQEKPPEGAVPAFYGYICPSCQIQLPAEADFCPRCGSQAVDVAPPSPLAGETCSQCGTKLAPGALFCSGCGAPPSSTCTCPSCQASVPAEAIFCPNCGGSTAPAVQEAPQVMEPATAPDQIVCPNCQASIPTEATFCPECGDSITSPPPEWAGEEVWPQTQETFDRIICPNCRASIPAEAIFCPECSSSVTAMVPDSVNEEPAPEVDEVLHSIICPNCHASMPVEADFCPECGTSIEPTPAEAEVQVSAEEQILPLPETDEMEGLLEKDETPANTLCPFCQASIPVEADFCPECDESISSVPSESE